MISWDLLQAFGSWTLNLQNFRSDSWLYCVIMQLSYSLFGYSGPRYIGIGSVVWSSAVTRLTIRRCVGSLTPRGGASRDPTTCLLSTCCCHDTKVNQLNPIVLSAAWSTVSERHIRALCDVLKQKVVCSGNKNHHIPTHCLKLDLDDRGILSEASTPTCPIQWMEHKFSIKETLKRPEYKSGIDYILSRPLALFMAASIYLQFIVTEMFLSW